MRRRRWAPVGFRAVAKTWILTGSPDNFRATREHGFRVIGAKEGRRRMAEQIQPATGSSSTSRRSRPSAESCA